MYILGDFSNNNLFQYVLVNIANIPFRMVNVNIIYLLRRFSLKIHTNAFYRFLLTSPSVWSARNVSDNANIISGNAGVFQMDLMLQEELGQTFISTQIEITQFQYLVFSWQWLKRIIENVNAIQLGFHTNCIKYIYLIPPLICVHV